MIRSDIVSNLLATYGKYGLTVNAIEEAIEDGIKNYDMTLEGTYNGLRMSLSKVFNEPEYFSIEDVMSITGESKEEVTIRIEEMLEEVRIAGGNPEEYAKEIVNDHVQRFIIPPGYLS